MPYLTFLAADFLGAGAFLGEGAAGAAGSGAGLGAATFLAGAAFLGEAVFLGAAFFGEAVFFAGAAFLATDFFVAVAFFAAICQTSQHRDSTNQERRRSAPLKTFSNRVRGRFYLLFNAYSCTLRCVLIQILIRDPLCFAVLKLKQAK
jgi:membrane-bound ClpP family serine protease